MARISVIFLKKEPLMLLCIYNTYMILIELVKNLSYAKKTGGIQGKGGAIHKLVVCMTCVNVSNILCKSFWFVF